MSQSERNLNIVPRSQTNKKLTVIPGDGIGPEITEQVIRILQKVSAPFDYEEHHAGLIAVEKKTF